MITERSGYVLQGADAHLELAKLALARGDKRDRPPPRRRGPPPGHLRRPARLHLQGRLRRGRRPARSVEITQAKRKGSQLEWGERRCLQGGRRQRPVIRNRKRSRGFGPRALQFFHELAMHNDREWFGEHKSVYEEEVVRPMAALVTALVAELAQRGLPLTGDPKRSMFRIHRDVRFSNDKSPYKTHSGAVLSRDGTKDFQGLLYIHVSPEGSFTASGFYHPDAAQLQALRRAIATAPERFQAVEAALQKARLTLSRGEALKRLPRGFEDVPEGPTAEILKLKSLIVQRELPEASLGRPRLVKDIADFAEAALPLLKFGWETLGRRHPDPAPETNTPASRRGKRSGSSR